MTVTASGGFSGSTTTDGNGDYTLTGIPVGTSSVVLTPTLSGHSMTPTTRTVTGPITADVIDQDFTSTPTTGPTLTVNATHGTIPSSTVAGRRNRARRMTMPAW